MFPDWVYQFKTPGTTIKKIGDSYYLYSATSKKVPGKKYPVSIQSYIGKITENGVIDSRKCIQISSTPAKTLGELVPKVPADLAGIILLEIKKEWYFTKISASKIQKLKDLGLFKEDKLLLRGEQDG